MQLPGHLRGKAAHEYSLLSSEEKRSFPTAVQALRVRLDPGSCTLAAQEFRNALQRDKESVSDYITRLERAWYTSRNGTERHGTILRNTPGIKYGTECYN